MTYPQQPEQYPGQPGQYPGQPGQYPAQPGQYQGQVPGGMPPQYGQYGQMPPMPQMSPYPVGNDQSMMSPPSGGTAITAGVLAILGALWAIVTAIVNLSIAGQAGGSPIAWVVWMQGIAFAVEVLTLGPGSIMLLTRRSAGQWLVAIGCALHIVQGIVGVIAIVSIGHVGSVQLSGPAMVGGTFVGTVLVLLPAIATLILVLLPQTGRWCAWRRRPAAPIAYAPPPQQQW